MLFIFGVKMTSFYVPKRTALLLGALFVLNPISMLLAAESSQSSSQAIDAGGQHQAV
jgi:iron complex outermembrane receptor protein